MIRHNSTKLKSRKHKKFIKFNDFLTIHLDFHRLYSVKYSLLQPTAGLPTVVCVDVGKRSRSVSTINNNGLSVFLLVKCLEVWKNNLENSLCCVDDPTSRGVFDEKSVP